MLKNARVPCIFETQEHKVSKVHGDLCFWNHEDYENNSFPGSNSAVNIVKLHFYAFIIFFRIFSPVKLKY